MNRTSAQKRSAEKFKQSFLFGRLALSQTDKFVAPPEHVYSIDEADDVITSLERRATARDMAE
jgi:hypothetical protein